MKKLKHFQCYDGSIIILHTKINFYRLFQIGVNQIKGVYGIFGNFVNEPSGKGIEKLNFHDLDGNLNSTETGPK